MESAAAAKRAYQQLSAGIFRYNVDKFYPTVEPFVADFGVRHELERKRDRDENRSGNSGNAQ